MSFSTTHTLKLTTLALSILQIFDRTQKQNCQNYSLVRKEGKKKNKDSNRYSRKRGNQKDDRNRKNVKEDENTKNKTKLIINLMLSEI